MNRIGLETLKQMIFFFFRSLKRNVKRSSLRQFETVTFLFFFFLLRFPGVAAEKVILMWGDQTLLINKMLCKVIQCPVHFYWIELCSLEDARN